MAKEQLMTVNRFISWVCTNKDKDKDKNKHK